MAPNLIVQHYLAKYQVVPMPNESGAYIHRTVCACSQECCGTYVQTYPYEHVWQVSQKAPSLPEVVVQFPMNQDIALPGGGHIRIVTHGE